MKKNRIKISVIVPVYHAESYIERCIQALLKQNYPEHRFEIIMVDNDANDRSAEMIKRYPRIVYLKEEKQGSYAARNKGIARARGDIIAFTDADCVPCVDWLQHIETAISRPDTHVVLGKNQFSTDFWILSMLSNYETGKAAYVFSGHDQSLYYAYANNMAVQKKLFDTIGLFMDIPRGADVIFIGRLLNQYPCDTVRFSHEMTVRHTEISSPGFYFRKQYVYGQSFRNYHKIVNSRALSTFERLKVYRSSCRKNHYSLVKSCSLIIILIIGALCYEFGRFGRK